MELSTRCPECKTVFPVSLERLQLRKGYIRCVHCGHIFDGFEEAVPVEGARTAAVHSLGTPTGAGPAVPNGPADPVQPFSIGAGRPSNGSGVRPAADNFTISALPVRGQGRREEPLLSAVHEETDGTADDVLYVEPRTARRSERYQPDFMSGSRASAWMAPVWAILTLCGLVLLAAQGVYVYRAQLANNFPGIRPVLEQACERLGCSVPYDRQIDAIAITGSALRSSGPPEDDVSRLVLEVTVRNAYDRPQEWPALVLDLKDASGTVVVRRNLDPDTWVPAELRVAPFAPGSEVWTQVPVSVRGVQANGYQLDKYFP